MAKSTRKTRTEQIEKVETKIEETKDAFDDWWDNFAERMLEYGHSIKSVFQAAAAKSEANYKTFVKHVLPAAKLEHGNDVKKIAKEAFHTKKK